MKTVQVPFDTLPVAPSRRARRLPPFFALRALEAAARHQSYTRAADELAVTHGAVSHQIRRLEAELGARLFARRGNAMEPTPSAAQLAERVAEAIRLLGESVAAFAGHEAREPLAVTVEPLFARRWLTSRLPALLAHPAGERLELQIDVRLADLAGGEADVGIRYGSGDWPGLEAERLFPLTLIPACAPELAEAHAIRTPRDLLAAPLLHRMERPWGSWFEALDLPAPPVEGLMFNDTLMMLEAAAQGLGVALAPKGLIAAELEAGRLVLPVREAVTLPLGFYVVWRADNRKISQILALRDWLVAEASRGPARAAAAA